jgi:hypothetical protein
MTTSEYTALPEYKFQPVAPLPIGLYRYGTIYTDMCWAINREKLDNDMIVENIVLVYLKGD